MRLTEQGNVNVEKQCFPTTLCPKPSSTLKGGLVSGRDFKLIMKGVVRAFYSSCIVGVAFDASCRPVFQPLLSEEHRLWPQHVHSEHVFHSDQGLSCIICLAPLRAKAKDTRSVLSPSHVRHDLNRAPDVVVYKESLGESRFA